MPLKICFLMKRARVFEACLESPNAAEHRDPGRQQDGVNVSEASTGGMFGCACPR